MKLSDIPDVNFTSRYKQKYIIASVSLDEAGEDAKDILYGDLGVRGHLEIRNHLERCGINVRDVKGGGRMQVLDAEKHVYLWAKSGEYGEADRAIAESLFKKSYPTYSVHFRPPPGHDVTEDLD